MKKNTVLAIVLSMIVFGVWMYIQQKYFPVENTMQSKPAVTENTEVPKNTFVQSESNEISAVTASENADESLREETYTVETDLIRAVFTNKGGDIVSYKLKEHASAGSEERVEMIENTRGSERALSLAFGGAESAPINFLFHVKQETLSDGKKQIGFFRDITVENKADGSSSVFTLAKRYTFIPGDYMFSLEITIDGKDGMKGLSFGDEAYTLRTAPQIGPEWNQSQDKNEYRYFSYFANGKKYEERGISAGKQKTITDLASWTAVSGKYFTFIVIPDNPIKKMTFSGFKAENNVVQNSQIFISRQPVAGNAANDLYRVYIGPCSEKLLNTYNSALTNNYGFNNLRIDEVASSGGFLYPLEWLLKKAMELLYKFIPNWGVAVILLTILLKIVFFPLTKKSSEATKKMQEMQPQIAEIQNKYKNNPQRMNAEMAKLYKEAGHNPLSGCLPMLIQIPFWFAMYRLFNNYFEFRGASFIPGWIPDLSLGDSILKFGFALPFLGWTDLRLLPVIYLVSQLLYGKLTQTPGQTQQNPSMKIMLYFMPLFLFFILYNAPSGLLLFWIFSNILMLLQQIIINKSMQAK
ncbi:membrane protein insertase YidC [Treponema pedis]|uniref:Membrane protein insertase YidC n=1 Tax=Treponema pedis TaxID=409322 RepID=A0A7S7AVS0_9SPIR|nr:membrane protein insertase YidC [Treponema pedis]QOW60485.1 membrane protein insertase YidC [Treponema pedis]